MVVNIGVCMFKWKKDVHGLCLHPFTSLSRWYKHAFLGGLSTYKEAVVKVSHDNENKVGGSHVCLRI